MKNVKKQTSPKKILANQSNSKKSTGQRRREEKASRSETP